MKRVKIEVEAVDIAKGKRRHVSMCPIAMASRRAGFERPTVGTDCIIYNVDSLPGVPLKEEVRLPLKARRFISRFDQGKPVKPFSFTVSVP